MIVAIKDMADGNAETGTAWQETKIFSDNTSITKICEWAFGANLFHDDPSKKRLQITQPDNLTGEIFDGPKEVLTPD